MQNGCSKVRCFVMKFPESYYIAFIALDHNSLSGIFIVQCRIFGLRCKICNASCRIKLGRITLNHIALPAVIPFRSVLFIASYHILIIHLFLCILHILYSALHHLLYSLCNNLFCILHLVPCSLAAVCFILYCLPYPILTFVHPQPCRIQCTAILS